jgi:hypothetical protein
MTAYTMRTAILAHLFAAKGFKSMWFVTNGEDIDTHGPTARMTITDFEGNDYLVTVRRIKDGNGLGSGENGLD